MALTAPTNQPTITTVAGPAVQIISAALQGPPGPPGPAANQLTIPAGTTVSADTAVAVVNGAVVPAQSGVAAHFGNVVGIAVNGGTAGTDIVIQQSGEMTLSSWNWTLGQPVLVGPNGPLTQVMPTTGFVQVVGIPINSNTIAVNIQPPIALS